MNSQNTRRFFATLIAATTLLGAATASAAGWQPEQRTIDLRGHDPATPAGAYNLYREIVKAANRVCGSTLDGATILARKNRNDAEKCRKQAIAAAVQTVDATFGFHLEQLAGVTSSDAPAVAQTTER